MFVRAERREEWICTCLLRRMSRPWRKRWWHILNTISTQWVNNGTDAYYQAMREPYDGLILDIMMPGMDGLQVLSSLRNNGKTTPVLLLTAKSQLQDKIHGFETGADDYLPKPFAMEELLARVGKNSSILSRREYQLMEFFMNNPGIYFSAETLLNRVWGMDAVTEQGTVWVHISYLRKKLQSLGAHAAITSKRGVGYALEEAP